MIRIGISLPRDDDFRPSELLGIAQHAEAEGYESVWVPEAWGRDFFTLATMIALGTRRIKIASGIIPVYSRSPALVAQSIASLDELSAGRAILGVGTSGRIVVENWHGQPFDRGIQRTREYVEIFRLALSGERVDYEGEVFHLRNFRLAFRPIRQTIPVYVAALSKQNLRLTGQIADGWLPTFVSPRHLDIFTEHLSAGASVSDRELADIDMATIVIALVADDTEAANVLVRDHLAYYVGGMGDFYNNLVCRYGFQREAEIIREAWLKGDRQAAANAVSDSLLGALTIIGQATVARRRLQAFSDAGIDQPVIMFPHGASLAAIHETISALAPERAISDVLTGQASMYN